MYAHARDLVLLLFLLPRLSAARVTGRVQVVGKKGHHEELLNPGFLIPGKGKLQPPARPAVRATHAVRVEELATTGTPRKMARVASIARMAFYPVGKSKAQMPCKKALKKRNGALTISVEYVAPARDDDVADVETSDMMATSDRRLSALGRSERLSLLSGKLREADVAAIWTADVEAVAGFVVEQHSARGDFPGPCPVIFNGDFSLAQAAIDAGADGVVLTPAHLESAASVGGTEIIWQVANASDVKHIVDTGQGRAFLMPAEVAAGLIKSLPSDAVSIAVIDAMQEGEVEIAQGRKLAAAGCNSVLVRGACVGDVEDLAYTRFAVKGLTSKRSSTFAIDGHTGAINGHFGGGREGTVTVPPDGWARIRT